MMPWRWETDAPAEWVQLISIYLNAKSAAQHPQQAMTVEQVAPFKPSQEEAEAYLKSIGAL